MKILAVDYGDSRTGLATCDRTEFLTTPITPQITLKARNKVAARVCEVAKEIGISQAQVSRLEKAALSHMRKLV